MLPGSTVQTAASITGQTGRRSSMLTIDEQLDDPEPTAIRQWMPSPHIREICAPGLEYLATLDELIIEQQFEMLEILPDIKENHRYEVKNQLGQIIYVAAEDSTSFQRKWIGTCREFHIRIVDSSGKEVIHVHRPRRYNCWCFPCNVQILEVMAPPGTIVGYVKEMWNFCAPKYGILNEEMDCVVMIKGPFCTCSLCGDAVFEILAKDGLTHIGKITKKWEGGVEQVNTEAENFGLSFPSDLDVNIKAVLVAAVFLIDFMFYESTTDVQRRN